MSLMRYVRYAASIHIVIRHSISWTSIVIYFRYTTFAWTIIDVHASHVGVVVDRLYRNVRGF